MGRIKIKSKELEPIWDELTDIFINYRCLNSQIVCRLTSIGFTVSRCGNHAKIQMPVGIMVISTTASDKNAGRQILRQIRRMYEQQYI